MAYAVHDLWAEAFARLSRKEQSLLQPHDQQDSTAQACLTLAGDVLRIVKEAIDKDESKRLAITGIRDKGKKIFVRDCLRNVAGWLKKFLDVGDQIIQVNPSHAALPWTALRFIVQFTVNDVEKHACVVDGIEKITHDLTRYALRERLYMTRSSDATWEFRSALVRFYASVLKYEAAAMEYYEKTKLNRILHSGLTGLGPFPDLLADMDKADAQTTKIITVLDGERQSRIEQGVDTLAHTTGEVQTSLDALEIPIADSNRRLIAIQHSIDANERLNILNWYSTVSSASRHNRISENVLLGTGKWLLQSPVFTSWSVLGSSSLLWLRGTLGMGKTCLTSIVIEHLRAQGCIAAFYYCQRDKQGTKKSDVLAGLARQLAQTVDGTILEVAEQFYYERATGRSQLSSVSDLTWNELVNHARQLCELHGTLFLVVDALDECDDSTELIDALQDLVQTSVSSIKVFVTSRDIVELEEQQKSSECIKLETGGGHSQDVVKFIDQTIESLIKSKKLMKTIPDGSTRDELIQKIRSKTVQKSQDMFRFAEMYLLFLCKLRTSEPILKFLDAPLPVLEDLYAKFLESLDRDPSITPPERQAVSTVINMLFWGVKELPIDELMTLAMASTEGGFAEGECNAKLIKDLLPGFFTIEMTDDGPILRLAHLSVREFLEYQPRFKKSQGHVCIAIACFGRMLLPRYTNGGRPNPLDTKWEWELQETLDLGHIPTSSITSFWYARSCFAYHCRNSTEDGSALHQDIVPTLDRWLGNPSRADQPFKDWLLWISTSSRSSRYSGDFPDPNFLFDGKSDEETVFLVQCYIGNIAAVKESIQKKSISSGAREVALEMVVQTGSWPLTELMVQEAAPFDSFYLPSIFGLLPDSGKKEHFEWLLENAHPCILDPSVLAPLAARLPHDMTTILLRHPRVSAILDIQFFDKVCKHCWYGKYTTDFTDEAFKGWLDHCPFENVTEDILLTAATRWTPRSYRHSNSGYKNFGHKKDLPNFQRTLNLAKSHDVFSERLLRNAALCGEPNILRILMSHPYGCKIPVAQENLLEIIKVKLGPPHVESLALLIKAFKESFGPVSLCAAEHAQAQIVEMLLPNTMISKRILHAAACRNTSYGFFVLLRSFDVAMGSMMLYAWTNSIYMTSFFENRPCYFRVDTWQELEDSFTKDSFISEECLLSLLKRSQYELIASLFEQCLLPHTVSQRVALASIEYHYAPEIVINILCRCHEPPPLTFLISALARNNKHCMGLFEAIFKDIVSKADITDDLILVISANFPNGHLLLEAIEKQVGTLNLQLLYNNFHALARASPSFLRIFLARHKLCLDCKNYLFDAAAELGDFETVQWLQSEFELTPQRRTLMRACRGGRKEYEIEHICHTFSDLSVDTILLHWIFSHGSGSMFIVLMETKKVSNSLVTLESCLLALLFNERQRLSDERLECFFSGNPQLVSYFPSAVSIVLDNLKRLGMKVQMTSSLLEAAAHHGREMLEMFLKLEQGMEVPALVGNSAEMAARAGRSDVLELLIELLDAEAVTKMQHNIAALVQASQSDCLGSKAVLADLLDAETPCDLPDLDGRTPLHRVSCPGNQLRHFPVIDALRFTFIPEQAEIIAKLVGAGANLETRDNRRQWTPLMWASWAFQFVAVDALLEAGADVNATNDAGETAASLADEMGHLTLAARLRGLMSRSMNDN